MSKNIGQIFSTNPASSMLNADLLYIGRSPYGIADDMAITWSNILSSIAVGATGTWNVNITGNAATVTTNASLSGPVSSVGNVTSITAHAITYGDIQQVAASSLLGNPNGSLNDIVEITLGPSLSFTGSVLNTTLAFPVSTTANYILYSSAANTIGQIPNANNSVLVYSGAGVPSASTSLPAAVMANITGIGAQLQMLNMNSNLISNVANPVSSQDAVNLQTLNTIASGLSPVPGVYSSSTANLTGYTYNNGVIGVGATLTAPSIGVFSDDAVSPPVNARWLYKDDATGLSAYNGIYIVTVSSTGAAAVLTRASDFNSSTNIKKGALVAVQFGTINGSSTFTQTNDVTVVGTDPIAFSLFFSAAAFLSSALSSGSIYVGNASNLGTAVSISGDALLSNAGVLTLATVNSNVGTFQGITVNAKGLVTAATNQNYLSNVLNSGRVFVGNVSNVATSVTMSGDATIINTGALTISANAVSYAKFQQVTANRLVGNPTGSLANMSEITVGTGLSFTGSTLNASGVNLTGPVTSVGAATSITNNAVGFAKLQQAFPQTLVGNPTSSTGNVFDINVGAGLSFTGSTLNTTGGTVSPGGANYLAYYATSGNMVSGLTTTPSASLVSDVSGVLSWVAFTGTGSPVRASSPILVTPNLGTPSSVVLTNGTNLSLTSGVTGILPSANGGTGINNSFNITVGGALVTAAALTHAGAFATIITSTAITNATLPAGTTTLVPTTGTGATGTWSISISGNSATVTTNASLTGPITSVGNATTVTNNAITYAKVQQVTASKLIGNPTGSTANISEITVGTGLSFSGSALNATAVISSGTANQIVHYAASGTTISGTGFIFDDTSNLFIGTGCGSVSVSGSDNFASGPGSLKSITSGSQNSVFGSRAGESIDDATANTLGGYASAANLKDGVANIIFGNVAGNNYTGSESRNIILGDDAGVLGESNTIRIGNKFVATTATYIAGINGVNVGSVSKVVTINAVSSGDKLGSATLTAGAGITITPTANLITITATPAGILPLANGGTNAALTASAGGLVYSTTAGLDISTPAGGANRLFLSGTSGTGAPTPTTFTIPNTITGTSGKFWRSNGTNMLFSTVTYADSYNINDIVYASSANTLSGLASAASAVLLTNSSSVPTYSSAMTNGQMIMGSTGATPALNTLTAGSGIGIVNGAGTVTISATGILPYVDNTATTPVTMVPNTVYGNNRAGTTLYNLPSSFTVGSVFEIVGVTGTAWNLIRGGSTSMRLGSQTTILEIDSQNAGASIKLIATSTTTLTVVSYVDVTVIF